MIGFLTKFIPVPYLVIGLAVALGLSTVANIWLFNSRDNALGKLATCNTLIEVQNSAVEEMERVALEVKDKHEKQIGVVAKLAEDALTDRGKLKKTLARLRAEVVPTDCPGAVNWLREKNNAVVGEP